MWIYFVEQTYYSTENTLIQQPFVDYGHVNFLWYCAQMNTRWIPYKKRPVMQKVSLARIFMKM